MHFPLVLLLALRHAGQSSDNVEMIDTLCVCLCVWDMRFNRFRWLGAIVEVPRNGPAAPATQHHHHVLFWALCCAQARLRSKNAGR
uniref:Putative secreted protein n=1 Tax=Anopheles darlingi TaxID=43151 RepID=A0A2M4DH19_ANODA